MSVRGVAALFVLVATAVPARAQIPGRVFSVEGKGVAGAVVAGYGQEPDDVRARRLVAGREKQPLATTTTGADGSFRLDTAEAVVAIAVRAEGFAPTVALGLQRELLTVSLKAAPPRRGKVTAAGSPLADAIVIWTAGSGNEERAEVLVHTGKDGSYEVPDPDRWATGLVIIHRDYALFTGAPTAGGWGKSLDRELAPGVALRGKVIDERKDAGVAGLTVWVDEWPRGESAADGSFVLPHVRSDWRSVTARSDSLVGTAKPGPAPLVITARSTRRLSGVVKDAATKQPLAGARVLIVDRDQGPAESATTTTDGRGQFALSLPPGRYMAYATRPGYETGTDDLERIDLRKSSVAGRSIGLAPLRRLAGRVVDEQSRPVEGALVTLGFEPMGAVYGNPGRSSWEDEDGGGAATRTAPDGSFLLSIAASSLSSSAVSLHGSLLAFKLGYAVGRGPIPDQESGPILVTLPRGETIQGRVAAADGTPLADVGIALAEGASLLDLRSLTLSNAEEVPAWAKSDSQGRFTVQVGPTVHHLLFRKAGFAARLLEGVDPRNLGDLDVVLERGAVVSGRVLRHDGRAVSGATVEVSDGIAANRGSLSGPDGSFSLDDLAPGRYDVRVRTELGLSAVRAVEAPVADLRLELAPTTTVQGRVVDASTRLPIPRFDVAIWPSSPQADLEVDGGRTQSFTAPDGRFVLDDVPVGESTFSVEAEGYRTKQIEGVSISEGADALDQEIALETGVSIRGRVTGPDSRAVAEASVSSDGDHSTAETDENGSYELRGVAPGAARIEVSKEGYRTARRTVEAREGTRLDVTLSQGLTLRGTAVLGGAGAPQVQVNARSSAVDADAQSATTDASGHFTLRGLAPGRYDVSARAADGAKADVEDVDVATAGPLRLVLERAPTAVLTGNVVGLGDAQGGRYFVVSVRVEGGEGPSAQGMVDGSGLFRVEGAPVGPVTVLAQAMGADGRGRTSERKELVLAAGTESATTLEFRDDLSVSGTVTRGGRDAPGAFVSFLREGVGPSSRTDREGHYTVNLAAGLYSVQLRGQGFTYEGEYLAQESGTFDIDVTGATLRGHAVEAGTSEPVADVAVSLWPLGTPDTQPAQELRSNASGGFEETSLREGRYRVVGVKKGFGQQVREIELIRGETAEVLLELQAADGVSLKVTDARDDRTLEAIVVVRDAAKRVVANRHAGTEADGAVTIPLADGPYLLSASSSGYGTVTRPVTSPARGLQVSLTPGGTLLIESARKLSGRVRLVQPDGDEYVRCWCNGIAEIKLEGSRTRVEHITPGSYSLELLDAPDRSGPRPVVIKEGQVSKVTIE